jgi:UDP-N-acetylglucosamine transferase subunit ALG13
VILVAVGTQFPFDRLVETVDRWAATCGTNVVGQIGPSTYKPAHIRAHRFIPPKEFESLLKQADVVIAHCGMGSILSALSLGRPIIVMPRSASRGEHRNDHQFATAERFSRQPGVTVAWDEAEMSRCLERISALQDSSSVSPIPAKAPRELTDRLRAFLWEGRR